MTVAGRTLHGTDLAAPTSAVGDSMAVAAWTVISRLTGLLRGVVIAAVLGATFFANTYQFTNSMTNLLFYGLLGGSLFSSLLVPALVRHIDAGDRRAAGRIAGGVFGCVVAAVCLLLPGYVLMAPAVLHLAGGGAEAGDQARAGGLLILLLMPQVVLYAVVGTATSVMNAHRRFALAAAAPALENLGIITVLVVVAVRYRHVAQAGAAVPTGVLLLLGLGTTSAVALHAATQWWGAWRVGIAVLPRRGWRYPEVRQVLRRGAVAVLQAALLAVKLLVVLALANRVAGGVVAIQLAVNFFFLPIAIGATPVALSLSPRLSRMLAPAERGTFRDTFLRGLSYALFVTVPAATAYLVLAGPISHAVAYGGFASGQGAPLLAAGLRGLALGVVGETVFMVTTYACYAMKDTRTPLKATLVQVGTCLVGAALAATLSGTAFVAGLGLAWSVGSLAGAAFLLHRLLTRLPVAEERLRGALLRTACASLAMAGPAVLAAAATTRWLDGPAAAAASAAVATLVGVLAYGIAHWRLGGDELRWALAALGRAKPAPPARPASPVPQPVPQPAPQPVPPGPPAPAAELTPRQRSRRPLGPGPIRVLLIDLVLLLGCAGAGAVVAYAPEYSVALLIAAGLGAWIVLRPAVAAYLLIGLTPLIAGIDRGALIPALRPNEALLALLAASLCARWLLRLRTGQVRLPRPNLLETSMVAMAVTSSVVPLMMMVARQRQISGDDLSHVIVVWKLVGVYAIVRASIATRRQAVRCLWVSLGAAAAVCLIGILQALHLLGVEAVLGRFYAPFGVETALDIGRGSSTLSLPAAVADLAIINFGLAIGMIRSGSRRRWLLLGLAVLYVFGVGAAAEFSTAIGLMIAFVVLVLVTGSKRLLGYAVPVIILAALALRPVIETRLTGFSSASGIPVSWIGRLRNLQTYFWPDLLAHWNWVLGVRPSSRVPAASQEFGWIWIESGYTWLLWGGGLPLLFSYLLFVVASMRVGLRYARGPAGPAAAAAMAVVAAVAAQAVLMLFDPHLTYRGAGDALFALLALLRPFPAEPQPVVHAGGTPDAAVDLAAEPPPAEKDRVT